MPDEAATAAPAAPPPVGRLATLLHRRELRFVLVGVFNTAVSFGAYLLLLALGLPYALANLLAMLLGIVVSFRTQGRWVFRQTGWHRLRRYVPAWAFIYAFNVGLIALLVRTGIGPGLAGALVLPVVVGVSYWVQKHFVFQGPAEAGQRA